MGAFDDLIPASAEGPPPSAGLFDDLIPKSREGEERPKSDLYAGARGAPGSLRGRSLPALEDSTNKEVPLAVRPFVGANRAIAGTAGLPMDIVNATYGRFVGQPLAKAITGREQEPIPGGSETMKKGLGLIGANPDDVRPAETFAEKTLEAGGEGATSMLVPGLGAEALLARTMGQSEALGAQLTRIIAGTGARSNTAIGAAGGALGEVAAEAVPPGQIVHAGPLEFSTDALRETARLGGNIAGGGLAAGATSGVEAAGRAVGSAVRAATESAELRAARDILARADQPQTFRGDVAEAANAPDLVPGSKPTTFQATGDLGVGGLEREVAASPKGVPRFAGVREEQNSARLVELENLQKALPENADPAAVSYLVQGRSQAIERTGAENVSRAQQGVLDEIEKLRTEGNPAAVANYVQSHVRDLEQTFGERVTAARTQLDDAFKAGQLNEAEYGVALREAPARLRAQLKQTESALWDAVDPDRIAPFNPTPLKAGIAAIEKAIPRTAKAAEGEERALFDVVKSLDDSTTFGDITALRGRLTDELRVPTNTPTVRRRISMMLDEVDKALGGAESTTPDLLGRYDAARAATADRYGRFGQGTVGRVLKEGDNEGFRMTASNIARNIFDRPEDLRAYLNAVGTDPATRAQLRDYAAFSLRKAAVRDGMMSDSKYQQWMTDHDYALREFPELRQQFGNMRAAQTALDDTVAAQKGALAEYQTGALSRVMEKDPTQAVGRALSDPVEFSAILDHVRGDPEALAGLKRAVTDYMMNRATGTAGGSAQVNVGSLEKFYLQNKAPLDKLFGDDLAKKLASVRNAQTTLEDALSVQKEALSRYQTGAIKRLIGTQDPEQVITNAIKKPGEFEALAREVADDPAAAAGMKRAVVDHMMSLARSTAEAGTSGEAQINAATLQKFFINNKRSLSALFTPEEMTSMNNVAADLQRANRSIVGVKMPGSPGTAQDISGNLKSAFRHLLSHGGATGGGAAGAMFGPVGMVAGAVAGAVADALRVARVNSIEKAVVEMMLDPKMANVWLAKVPVQSAEAAATTFARRLKAVAVDQVTRAIDQEGSRSEARP